MKKYAVITNSISLLGILMTLARPNIPIGTQAGHAVLRFAPSALELRPNTQGIVDVRVENVQALYGLEFQISFDPALLEVIDADPVEEGIQIQPAECWKEGFVAVNKVDNGSGRIDFAATLLRPARAVSGNRTMATITFAARQTGSSGLRFEAALLSTPDAEEINYTNQAGKIGVKASGQAAGAAASARSGGQAPGRWVLAGAGVLAFLVALGAFIYTMRRS